jgi:hypothetical protein
MHPRRTDRDPQVIVEAVIKPTSTGTEMLVFSVPLGPVELTCLVNIPPDGETRSSVYVKFRFRGSSTRGAGRANMQAIQE